MIAIATLTVAVALRPTRATNTDEPRFDASAGAVESSPSSSSASPSIARALAVATKPPGSIGSDALAVGVLDGQRRDDIACLWLTQDSGREALLWPFGFSALDDPLRIIGPDGQALAEVGDEVELGGGSPPLNSVRSGVMDRCSIGALFDVSVVARVNGTEVDVGEGSLRLTTRRPGAMSSCPATFLDPVVLVMSDGRLRLRTPNGDVDATWPDGFSAKPGNRIRIVDADGVEVMRQGLEVADARGVATADRIDICGIGSAAYP
jgi:hypothetical protein